MHVAVDTLGNLLALVVTAANEQERAQVAALAEQVQAITGQSVELAFVDQGYTGKKAAEAAAAHGIQLEVVKLADAKRGFVLLPRRWVVERSFAWLASRLAHKRLRSLSYGKCQRGGSETGGGASSTVRRRGNKPCATC